MKQHLIALNVAACLAAIAASGYAMLAQRVEVVLVGQEDDCAAYHGALDLTEVVRVSPTQVACVYPW